MFTFEVNKNEIKLIESETITSGSVNIYFCQFTFSSDWAGLAKTITFRTDYTSISILLDSTNICSIPWEVLQHDAVQLYCGVRGTVSDTDTEEEAVIPTTYCLLGTIRKGAELGDNAQPPLPSVVDQLTARIEEIDTSKQDKLVGTVGQVVSFDEFGNVIARDEKGTEYKAGDNISISADNVISASMYDDTEIRGEINSVKTVADKNAAEIVKNAGAIADNTEAIVKNADEIAKNKDNIAKNAADIAKNSEAIAKNIADIAKNTGNVAKNTEAISKNTADISTINDSVATINTKLNNKQNKLTAGDNIHIVNDLISADTYNDTEIRSELTAQSKTIKEHTKAIADNSAAINVMKDDINTKQNKLVGQAGQIVGFDEDGNAIAQDGGTGTPGRDGTTFTPMVSPEGVISWTNDGGKENPEAVNIKGEPGSRGVTFTPTVSPSGVLSWSNDGGLDNPPSVNITGPAGEYTAGDNINISEDNVISAAAYNDTAIREEIRNVKTTADGNTEAIAANAEAITSNSADISSNAEAIAANAAEIARVGTFADETAATAAANTAAISSINGSVERIDKSVADKQNKLTAGENIRIENDVISAATYDDTEVLANIAALDADKQNKLTAGDNIHISNDVISADMYDDTSIRSDITALDESKQNTLTAGDNIHISNDVISADMYDDTSIRNEIAVQSSTISEHSTNINANTTAISAINDTLANKQNTLTAGDNVHISANNVISSDMYDDTSIRNELNSQGETISGHGVSINANSEAISVINNTLTNKQNTLTAGAGISISGDTIALSDTASTKKLATGSLTSFGGVTVTSVNNFTLNRQTSNLSLISEYIHTDATSYTEFKTYYGYLEAYLNADADKTLSATVPMYLHMSHSISFPAAVGFAIIKVSTLSRYIAMAESSGGIIRLYPTQSVSITSGASITVYLYLR